MLWQCRSSSEHTTSSTVLDTTGSVRLPTASMSVFPGEWFLDSQIERAHDHDEGHMSTHDDANLRPGWDGLVLKLFVLCFLCRLYLFLIRSFGELLVEQYNEAIDLEQDFFIVAANAYYVGIYLFQQDQR
eukprot:4589904-Amphidinium_carterae.1